MLVYQRESSLHLIISGNMKLLIVYLFLVEIVQDFKWCFIACVLVPQGYVQAHLLCWCQTRHDSSGIIVPWIPLEHQPQPQRQRFLRSESKNSGKGPNQKHEFTNFSWIAPTSTNHQMIYSVNCRFCWWNPPFLLWPHYAAFAWTKSSYFWTSYYNSKIGKKNKHKHKHLVGLVHPGGCEVIVGLDASWCFIIQPGGISLNIYYRIRIIGIVIPVLCSMKKNVITTNLNIMSNPRINKPWFIN